MDIGVLVAFAACVAIFALAVGATGGTVRVIGGMFRVPDLGWPAGVQEDDDLHWAWAGAAPGAERPRIRLRVGPPDPEPEVLDIEPTSLDLPREPVRRNPHVSHRRDRPSS